MKENQNNYFNKHNINNKRPTYDEQCKFFISIGYRATGFGGVWSNGDTSVKINFLDNKTNFEPKEVTIIFNLIFKIKKTFTKIFNYIENNKAKIYTKRNKKRKLDVRYRKRKKKNTI